MLLDESSVWGLHIGEQQADPTLSRGMKDSKLFFSLWGPSRG